MPKRKLSEEHKAKLNAGLARKREERREAARRHDVDHPSKDKPRPNQPVREPQPEPRPEPTPEPHTVPNDSADPTNTLIHRLIAEIDELKSKVNAPTTPEEGLQFNAEQQGKPIVGHKGIQGKLFKYSVEPSHYPNPVDRLYDLPELKRHGLRDNYLLDWEVEGVEYEKYGVTYAEPRFTVRLFRRLFDDNDQPNGKMALINRQIQHEDEVVARSAADKLGITDSFPSFEDMMDEMRFQRIKDWLLELFMPAKVTHHNHMPIQQVIAGKVVEVFDTETLVDGSSGKDKAQAISQQVRF